MDLLYIVRRYWIDHFFFESYSNGSSWLIFLCVKSTYRTHWQSCSNIFSMCIDLSVNYIMFIVGEEKCRQGYMLLTDNHCLHMPPKMFSICTVSPSGFLNTSCLSHVEFVVFRLDVAISIFSFFLLYLFLFLFFHMYLKEAMVSMSFNGFFIFYFFFESNSVFFFFFFPLLIILINIYIHQ